MRVLPLCLTVLFCVSGLSRADWPQFRGPNSSGVAPGRAVPTDFGPGKNELWSLALEPGHSSPVVVGDAIFLTTFDADARELGVVSIARRDGKIRWRATVRVDELETGHPSFNPASSTVACDGERVVAYFGSFGLICFDIDGRKIWDVEMPLTKSYAGNATSPAIVGDRVILYRGNHVDHFLLAVHKETGREIWRVEQDEPFATELACTACPIAFEDKLIVHTARSLQVFDVSDGARVWVAKCATTATSTPVIAGEHVVVAAWNKMGEPALRPEFPSFLELVSQHDRNGNQLIQRDELPRLMIFHRPDGAEAPQNGASLRFESVDDDQNGEINEEEWTQRLGELETFRAGYRTHGMLAIPLDSTDVVPTERVRTLANQGIPEVPSPLFHDGYLYFVKNGGVLTTVDFETGARTRIRTKGRGTHYASPIISGDKLITTAGNGVMSVLTLGAKPKILAINDMQDRTYASPAAVDGTLYVRTHSKLFAFGTNEP